MSPFIYMLMKNIPKNSSSDAFYDDCSHIRKFKFLSEDNIQSSGTSRKENFAL